MINGTRHIPLINGVEPSWANLVVTIEGVPSVGITKISYGDDQDMENVYGAGQNPIGRGYGNIEPKASLTLLRSEIEAIRKASITGRLQDIAPFDILVSFVPVGQSLIINHTIKNCQFKTDGLEISQGDTKNEQDFELIVGSIKWK